MSRLEELIQELCPNGVEYKKICEICETITDYTAAGSFADIAKNVKYINNKVGYAQLIRTTDLKSKFENPNKFIYVDEHAFNYLWRVNLDIEGLVLPNVGNCGEVYYVTPNRLPFEHNVLGPNAIWVRSCTVENRYLHHLFLSSEFQKKLSKIISPTGQKKFNKTNFKALTIPVPPLEVQREIVRILDNFTSLTAELQARKKQYEYYHNCLMDFSGRNIEYKSVGELFEIKNGLNKEKDAFGKGQPIINFTDVYNKRWLANGSFQGLVDVTEEEIKRYSAKKGDVFFTRTSETKEDIGMSSTLIEDIPNCVFSGFVLRARPITNLLLPKFCSYYFSTNKVRGTIIRYAAFTTRATTTGPKLSKIMVPIISIKEQERIVSILDRFDSLCNNISSGLPAEIEARQKQYEYYRDKLLSFQVKSYD
jgi:type I restriction enzyme S subunit